MARWWRNSLALLALALLPSLAAAQPSCLPSQIGGTGTAAVVRSDTAGRSFGWWCPDPYVPARLVIVTGRHSDFVPDWERIGLTALAQGPAAVSALWKQYATAQWPRNAEGGLIVPSEIYPVHMLVWNALVAASPPAPVWKVAPNPGYTTRPAFAYSGGIRATTATARATAGVTCYCDTRDLVGSTVYCAVNSARTWMSVCNRTN
jgi:hypothetical protein